MNFYFPVLLSFLAILPICYCTSAADENISYKDNKLYQINGTADAINDLAAFVDNLNTTNYINYGGSNTSLYFIMPPRYVNAFEGYIKEHNLTKTIISSDYQQYIDNGKAAPGSRFSWTAYFDIPDIYGFLRNTSSHHRKFAKVVKGGSSYEGRDILGLNINTGGKGKPAFYIESGIHAREWITPAATTYFINKLLADKDPKILALRDQFDWHIFPCINPDGYHYSYTVDRFWRKSRSKSPSGCHGVDLNRNWDTENWLKYSASNDSCDLYQYAGQKPFSEPETLSMSQYISKIPNLKVFASFHSDFQMLLIPYSGSDERVDNYKDLIRIGNTSLEYAFRVNGARYDGPGTAGDISYKSSGESIDWAKRSLKVPLAFEYELRGVLFDWPPSKINQQGDEFTQIVLGLVTEAKHLGYFGITLDTVAEKNSNTNEDKNTQENKDENPEANEAKIPKANEAKSSKANGDKNLETNEAKISRVNENNNPGANEAKNPNENEDKNPQTNEVKRTKAN